MQSHGSRTRGVARIGTTLVAALAVAACASGGRTTTTGSGGDAAPAGAVTTGPGADDPTMPGSQGAATQTAVDNAGGRDVGATTGTSGSPGAAGGSQGAGTTTTEAGSRMSAAGDAMGARSDAHIVGLLHESNLGEIRAGTAAQQRATNSAVRSFAQQMITEHTALDQRGNALASQAGIAPALPDSMLPRQHATELATLQGASGAAFDRAYMAQQVMAHQRTLALVDASIPMASNAALRTMLQSEVRPRVADHLRHAQQLQTQVGTAP